MLFRNDCGDFEKQRLDGTSIGFATSDNGIDWTVADRPCFDLSDNEIDRVYDPRITIIDGVCFALKASKVYDG